jgi:hypothetical protein
MENRKDALVAALAASTDPTTTLVSSGMGSGGAGGSSKAPNIRRSKCGGGGKGQGSRPPVGTTQQQQAAGQQQQPAVGGALGLASTIPWPNFYNPWRPSRCPLTSKNSTRRSSSRRLLPTSSLLPMVLDSGPLRGITTL